MSEVTNDTIYTALMDIKEDIGSLKTSSGLQIEGLKSCHSRIAVLEGAYERQKGSVKVWGIVATFMATMVGALIQFFKQH